MPGEKIMSIYLHREHGVNAAVFNCYICGESQGVILPGAKVQGFKEAGLADSSGKMNKNIGCIDKEPCFNCKEIMRQGIIFISTKDDDREYRTGGWCAVKEEAVRRMGIPAKILERICTKRVCFIQDSVYDDMGLPRNVSINNLK